MIKVLECQSILILLVLKVWSDAKSSREELSNVHRICAHILCTSEHGKYYPYYEPPLLPLSCGLCGAVLRSGGAMEIIQLVLLAPL